MHGTSTAERLVRIASAQARQMGQSTVKAVRVRIAGWSHITADELRQCFEVASRGQPTERSELSIEVVEPLARCQDCGADYSPDSGSLRCPSCGGSHVVLDRSSEVELEAVEV